MNAVSGRESLTLNVRVPQAVVGYIKNFTSASTRRLDGRNFQNQVMVHPPLAFHQISPADLNGRMVEMTARQILNDLSPKKNQQGFLSIERLLDQQMEVTLKDQEASKIAGKPVLVKTSVDRSTKVAAIELLERLKRVGVSNGGIYNYRFSDYIENTLKKVNDLQALSLEDLTEKLSKIFENKHFFKNIDIYFVVKTNNGNRQAIRVIGNGYSHFSDWRSVDTGEIFYPWVSNGSSASTNFKFLPSMEVDSRKKGEIRRQHLGAHQLHSIAPLEAAYGSAPIRGTGGEEGVQPEAWVTFKFNEWKPLLFARTEIPEEFFCNPAIHSMFISQDGEYYSLGISNLEDNLMPIENTELRQSFKEFIETFISEKRKMCSNRAFYPAAVEYPSINEFKYDADRTGYRRNIDELLKELMRTVARKIQETVSAEPGKKVEREPKPQSITAPTAPLMAKQPEQVLSDEEKREIIGKGISFIINGQKVKIFEIPFEKFREKKDAVINWLRDEIIAVYDGTERLKGKTKDEIIKLLSLEDDKMEERVGVHPYKWNDFELRLERSGISS